MLILSIGRVALATAFVAINGGMLEAQGAKPQPRRSANAVSLATIEGDIYFVTQSGDVKRGASNTVRLAPSDSVTAIRESECPRPRAISDSAVSLRRSADSLVNAILVPTRKFDTVAYNAASKARILAASLKFQTEQNASILIHRRLLAASIREARTGMEAHYVIDSVAPGRYVAWAETQIGDNFYQWLAVVSLAPGEHKRLDLDNSVLTGGAMYCGFSPNIYWFR